MDRDSEMMMHAFMEKEANATADEDEHFAILACLLQFQALNLNNVAPICGGSRLQRRKNKQMRRMEGHDTMLYVDYFAIRATVT
jgi:hypothetical protein